jgi:hypothetical protein
MRPQTRTVLHFLSRRVVNVAERAVRGQSQPLLAAPTHAGGWIDPVALVERLKACESISAELDRLDEVQALLRLAPDHRKQALRKIGIRKIGKSATEFEQALRYALGAQGVSIGPTASLWIAAARARASFDDDHAVEARHPGFGPDGGRAARLTLKTRRFHQRDYFHLDQEPPLSAQITIEFPTALLHAGARTKGWDCPAARWSAAAVRWAGSVWPVGREAWFSAGAYLIGRNLDWWEAEWGNRAYLEALVDPDVPLLPMPLHLLALGLAAKEAGEGGMATDALIAAIDDGRVDGLKMGEAMASLLATGLIKPGWARTLAAVARISHLHAAEIALAIQRSLQGAADRVSKEMHALLALLKELLISAGSGLRLPEARDFLTRLQGSGKTGDVARTILALEDEPTSPQAGNAAARALANRVDRAERWSRCAAKGGGQDSL